MIHQSEDTLAPLRSSQMHRNSRTALPGGGRKRDGGYLMGTDFQFSKKESPEDLFNNINILHRTEL